MKIKFSILFLGILLLFTSCGEQHKAQSLVKDFLNENLIDNDCSFERFSKLTPTAMINAERLAAMRKDIETLPIVKKGIQYGSNDLPDTLLYIRATYKLTGKNGEKEKFTQTFYMDKGITHIIAFKKN